MRPVIDALSADAAVQCDLDGADDMLVRRSQALEAPSKTSRTGSCPDGSPLMVEIGESSMNGADHH